MYCCLARDPFVRVAPDALSAVAYACSPRVELFEAAAIFDASGLARVIGAPAEIAREVQHLAETRGLTVRVAVARTITAAWLLAHARAGCTVAMMDPADAVASLPLGWLGTLSGSRLLLHDTPDVHGTRSLAIGARKPAGRRAGHFRHAPGPIADPRAPRAQHRGPDRRIPDALSIFERWGLRVMGDLARLPDADLLTRLGPLGARLHQAARGEDAQPLVPSRESPAFGERIELEWPIEGLEPLSFVLARLCESLSLTLERADRGAVALTTTLGLVTRVTHARTLHVPSPMRDAKVLRTLILLDLESHPPTAAIDVVEVVVEVTPGRIEQGSLLTHTLPTPENLSTLLARLGALMGESRVGAPALVDTFDERVVAMAPFEVKRQTAEGKSSTSNAPPVVVCPLPFAFRRFRIPVSARVRVEHGAPVQIEPSARELAAGRVVARAGPWRSAGAWWTLGTSEWHRDEWEVEIDGGGLYRIARDRATGQWSVDGTID